MLRPFLMLVALAALVCAANPKAEKLAKDAAAAEKSGDIVRAYLLWAQAAAEDRHDASYWARAESLRAKASMAAGTRIDTPELTWSTGKPPVGNPVTTTFTQQDLDDLKRMAPPPRLRPSLLTKTFHLKANAKPMYEQVAKEFGYIVVFDKDYNPNGEIHFDVTDLGYREALHALEGASNTFIVPISDTAMMVAQDTPQKRTELENDEAIAIPIPQRSSVQEAQELLTLVQQTFEVRRAVVDPQKRMVLLRDKVSKVEAALAVMNQIANGKPQVSLEVELLAAGETSSLSFGMNLPTQFPLVDFHNFSRAARTIPAAFSQFLTFGGGTSFLGLGLANASLFATASRSSATSLLRSTIAASDGQPATMHIGNKYPIVTGGYMGLGGFSSSGGGLGGGTTGGGVTYAVLSTTSYLSDLITSAVSSTGKMNLVVNGVTVPLLLPAAANNLAGIQSVINSLGAGVYASVVQRGTTAKPISLVLVASALATTSIQLVDDPDGAAIDLMRPVAYASSISNDVADAVSTSVSSKGSLSLQVGEKTYPITLDSGKNNLNGIRDAINATDAGVKASVLLSNIVTTSVFLQVVATSADTGTIQLYDDLGGTTKALLSSTDEVNYAGNQFGQSVAGTSTGSGSSLGQVYTPPPVFNFEDLGLLLKVTPYVHGPDEVSLEIETEFKSLGGGSINGVPIISTRKYQGKVRLRSSEWAVVAGLLTESSANGVNGLPGIKDIPALGTLLSNNTRSSERDNILLVIKPRITSLPGSESVGRPIWVGSETRMLSPL